MKIYSILIFCSLYCELNGQNQFKEFLAEFEKVELPTCIQYSTRDAAFLNQDDLYDTLSFEGELYRDSSQIIPQNFVVNFLLQNRDSVPVLNIWDLDTINWEKKESWLEIGTFYYGAFLFRKKNFVVISYELWIGEASLRFICTFDKQGNLISSLLSGFYAHSGSSTMEDGSRMPWWAEKTFCIDKNLIITTNADGQVTKYMISKIGVITKM